MQFGHKYWISGLKEVPVFESATTVDNSSVGFLLGFFYAQYTLHYGYKKGSFGKSA